MVNADEYVDEIYSPLTNVYTWATPIATCVYPVELLLDLNELLQDSEYEMTGFPEFQKVILREEKRLRGVNYCDEEWVGTFAKTKSYSTTKSCGIQTGMIQNKLFSFNEDFMGVWNLKTNENLVKSMHIKPYTKHEGNVYYSFSDILSSARKYFPDVPINVLDCTCSVVLDEYTTQRMQRRLQRHIIPSRYGGWKKITHKRRKRKSSMLNKKKKIKNTSLKRKNLNLLVYTFSHLKRPL